MELQKEASITLLIGKPKTGKSFCLKSLVYRYSKSGLIKFGIVFCKTKFTGQYDYIPDEYVFQEYSEELLSSYIESLRKKRAKTGKQLEPNFVIFDDLLGQVNFYSSFFTNWISTFRHTNTYIFFISQQLKRGLSTTLRECCDLAIMYNTSFKDSIVALYEAFGTIFENYKQFRAAFDCATEEDHYAMVFVNGQKTVEDSYYSYKCAEPPEFALNYS